MAIVGGLSALGGTVAGGAAALAAVAVLTPSEPVSAGQVALMVAEYGFVAGVAGAVLGTLVAFGALRRVSLGRLLLCTNGGLAAGLAAGWLGGPWAWHHMGFLGFAGFSAGALLARAFARGVPAPTPRVPFASVPVSGTIASAPHLVLGTPAPAAELPLPADSGAERVRRNELPQP